MSQKSITIGIVNNNKVLLLKRGESAPYQPNKYCLPGGGVEKGESLVNAIIRETLEETNLTFTRENLRRLVVSYKDGRTRLIYAAKVTDPIVVLNYEHSDYVWLDYDSCWKYYHQGFLVPYLITKLKTLHEREYF